MKQIRKYALDGFELSVPAHYDDLSGKYLEDYSLWNKLDQFTPSGYLILCSAEEACDFGEKPDGNRCVECADCRFYKRAAPHTLIGICMNTKMKLNCQKEIKKEMEVN